MPALGHLPACEWILNNNLQFLPFHIRAGPLELLVRCRHVPLVHKPAAPDGHCRLVAAELAAKALQAAQK